MVAVLADKTVLAPNTYKAFGKAVIGVVLAVCSFVLLSHSIVNYPSVLHPDLGRIPQPNERFLWRLEGNGSGLWSSNGLRGPFTFDKPGPRLLILGDSFAEALHVTDSEHFGRLLQQQLEDQGSDWRVGTAAKSGYSVADYISKAALFRRLHAPDWVVIQLTDHDFGPDAWEKRSLGGYAHFDREPGSISLNLVDLQQGGSGLSGKANDNAPFLLPAALFIANRKGVVEGWLRDNSQPWFHAQVESSRSAVPALRLADFPVREEVKLLRDAYPTRLTLLYLPRFDPERLSVETENEALVRSLAGEAGIEFLSLRAKFPALHAQGRCPYGFSNTRINEGHWNRDGHRAAADLLMEHILNTR